MLRMLSGNNKAVGFFLEPTNVGYLQVRDE